MVANCDQNSHQIKFWQRWKPARCGKPNMEWFTLLTQKFHWIWLWHTCSGDERPQT